MELDEGSRYFLRATVGAVRRKDRMKLFGWRIRLNPILSNPGVSNYCLCQTVNSERPM